MTGIYLVAAVLCVLSVGLGYLLFCALRLKAIDDLAMKNVAKDNRAHQLELEKKHELL